MSISPVGKHTTKGTGTAASDTHGLTILADDVVVCLVHVNADTNTITDSNGSDAMTEALADQGGSSNRWAIFARRAPDGSEPAAYAFTLGSSDRWTVQTRVYRGVHTTSMWDVAPDAGNYDWSNGSTTATAPTITTDYDGSLVIAAFFSDFTDARTWSGVTNSFADELEDGGGAVGMSTASYTKTQTTAGAVGSTSATLDTSDDWLALMFALRAADATPPPDPTPPTPVSDSSWQTAVEAQSQVVISTCAAYLNGEVIAELIPVGGSVSADWRRATMRTATLEFAPAAGQTTAQLYLLLATPGLELWPRRGFVYTDGSVETRALGHYLIDSLSYSEEATTSVVSAACSDVSVRIQRAAFTDPYQIAAGTTLAAGVGALLTSRWPNVYAELGDVTGTLAAQVTLMNGASSNPWEDARKLMENYGYVLYIDAEGTVRALIPPEPAATAPSRIYRRGAAALITKRSWSLPMDRVRNGVIVTGEGSEVATPVRGEAWDTDPTSPTYYLGPLGAMPEHLSSSVISTQTQAIAVARARLALISGRMSSLSVEQIVDASLAPLDVIAIEDAAGGVINYLVDAVTTPLSPEAAQSLEIRSSVVPVSSGTSTGGGGGGGGGPVDPPPSGSPYGTPDYLAQGFDTYVVPSGMNNKVFESCIFDGGLPDWNGVLTLTNPCHDLVFYKCTIKGGPFNGVTIVDAGRTIYNIVFDTCTFEENGRFGFECISRPPSGTLCYSGIQLLNCTFAQQGGEVVSFDGQWDSTGCVIHNCDLNSGGMNPTWQAEPGWGSGLEINGPHNFTVTDNIIRRCYHGLLNFQQNDGDTTDCGWVFTGNLIDGDTTSYGPATLWGSDLIGCNKVRGGEFHGNTIKGHADYGAILSANDCHDMDWSAQTDWYDDRGAAYELAAVYEDGDCEGNVFS